MEDITVIIKTFNRKHRLCKLLDSIERYYPSIKIVIVDDSKKTYRDFILRKYAGLQIEYIITKYNIGLSAGRNVLINKVKTKYFLLCDDDFVFDERTDIGFAKKCLERYDMDILGGVVYNRMSINSVYSILWSFKKPSRLINILRSKEFISIYNGNYACNDTHVKLYVDKNFDNYNKKSYYRTDICSNFFLAKTNRIKAIGGWKPELLKVGEHEIFFFRAKARHLKVGFCPKFGVQHFPKKTIRYLQYREKAETYFKEACNYLKIKEFSILDGKKVLMQYKEK